MNAHLPQDAEPLLAHGPVQQLIERRVFETAVHRTRMAMTLADATLPDCPLVYVNEAFERLTGYAAGSILGRNCRFLQGPQTDPAAVRRIRTAISNRSNLEQDIYNYRSDGSGFWNALFISPIFDASGRLIYFFANQIDITARKQLQDSREVLLAELQHRTRNLLAVIEAMTQQTLRRSSSAEAFAKDFQGRLGAISRVQGLLGCGRAHSLNLRALVVAELTAHGAVGPAKVRIQGPDLTLPAKAVQVLALALHELATNAVKYGALSQTAGRLTVGWDVAQSGGQARMTLTWRESGVTLPSRPGGPSSGYGRELIERALPYQLGAETHFTFEPDGVCCRIGLVIQTEPAGTSGGQP